MPCAESLGPFDAKYTLALEAVEVLGEAPAIGSKIMPFYQQG